MSDRYMTVVAMLDDPDTMLCVLRELRRRHGAWPEAASLYAVPWRDAGNRTHVLTRLPEVKTPPFTLARVEQDSNGWTVYVPGEGEFGPFDTLDEAKGEAEGIVLSSGEVMFMLTELPWTPEDDMEWPLVAPPVSYR